MSQITPKWALTLPWDLIREYSGINRLDPMVVAAVVQTECGGNPWRIRYEPQFRWLPATLEVRALAERLGLTEDTALMALKTSWGPMQIMGATAYSSGYRDQFPMLSDWETGLRVGCDYLRGRAERYGSDPATLYAAYNAGSVRRTEGGMFVNQRHVDNFYRYLRALTELE